MESLTGQADAAALAKVMALGLKELRPEGVPVNHYSRLSSQEDYQGDANAIPEFPGYEVHSRLGRGGMGTVWRATQLGTRREVALKLMGAANLGSDRSRRRFEREIELAARLEHPSIARLYESGSCGGICYYAMELVEGLHLDRYVQENKLDHRQVLALMRGVCLAVQQAHQRGVIHRDLKPSNILVTADGQPHVVDFGLAKAITDDGVNPTLTQDGQYVGTPAFMSPEQASGRWKHLDTRTDVYALGATLYLLLVGQPPHDQNGPRYEVLCRVAGEEVRRPRQLNKTLDAELEALLLKALDRDPDRRYASAGELAQDIEQYLNGEPIHAAARSAMPRLRTFIRKHRVPLGVVATAAVVLFAASALSTWQAVRATRAHNAEVELRKSAQRATAEEAIQRKQAEVVAAVLEPVFRDLVRDNNSLGLYEEARDNIVQSLGPDHASALMMLSDLAGAYESTGRTAEAIKLYKQVWEQRVTQLGADHPDTLAALGDLGGSYQSADRTAELVKLFERERDLRVKRLGPQHPDTLTLTRGLASAYLTVGRSAEAITLLEQVRDQKFKRLGTARPDADTLPILGNLASAYLSAGRREEGIKLAERVSDQALKTLGPDNRLTWDVRHDLANAYRHAGRMAEAITLREQLRDQAVKDLGLADPLTWTTIKELAFAYRAAGRTAEAIKLFQQVRGPMEHSLQQMAVLPARTPIDAVRLAERGRLYARLGRFREAAADFAKAIELAPENHLYWHDGLMPLLLQLGEVDEFRRRLAPELQRFRGTSDGIVAHRVSKDAFMMPLDGEQLRLAVDLADRALGSTVETCGYETKGMAEFRSGHYRQTIPFLIRTKELNDDPHWQVKADLFLAMCFERLGEHEQACAALDRGIWTMELELPKVGEGDLELFSDWIFCHLARREAEAMIGTRIPTSAPAATQPH